MVAVNGSTDWELKLCLSCDAVSAYLLIILGL